MPRNTLTSDKLEGLRFSLEDVLKTRGDGTVADIYRELIDRETERLEDVVELAHLACRASTDRMLARLNADQWRQFVQGAAQ